MEKILPVITIAIWLLSSTTVYFGGSYQETNAYNSKVIEAHEIEINCSNISSMVGTDDAITAIFAVVADDRTVTSSIQEEIKDKNIDLTPDLEKSLMCKSLKLI